VNLLRVGFLFFDFIPAEWQVSKQITSPFCFQPMGWLCIFAKSDGDRLQTN